MPRTGEFNDKPHDAEGSSGVTPCGDGLQPCECAPTPCAPLKPSIVLPTEDTGPSSEDAERHEKIADDEGCFKFNPKKSGSEVLDGASESVAKLADPVLDEVLPYPNAGGLLNEAGLVGQLNDELHAALVRKPAEEIISGLGIPGADPVGSIIGAMPIRFIDHSLGDIKRWIEISGFCIGIMCGHLTMALACLKALAHDEIHNAVASGVKSLLTGGATEEPSSTGMPPPSTGTGEGAPVASLPTGLGTRGVRQVTTRDTAPAPEPTGRPGPAQEVAGLKPPPRDITPEPSPGGNSARADVIPEPRQSRQPPTDASPPPTEGQASMKRPTPSTGPGELQEASENPNAAISRPGGATTPVIPQLSPPPSAAVPAEAMCMRLRIHYQRAEVVSALIVGQEASAPLACPADGRTGAAGNATRTAREAKTGTTWQRWRAADDSGFADGSPGADALRRRLRSILTGAAPGDDPAMKVERPAR